MAWNGFQIFNPLLLTIKYKYNFILAPIERIKVKIGSSGSSVSVTPAVLTTASSTRVLATKRVANLLIRDTKPFKEDNVLTRIYKFEGRGFKTQGW